MIGRLVGMMLLLWCSYLVSTLVCGVMMMCLLWLVCMVFRCVLWVIWLFLATSSVWVKTFLVGVIMTWNFGVCLFCWCGGWSSMRVRAVVRSVGDLIVMSCMFGSLCFAMLVSVLVGESLIVVLILMLW